MEILKTSTEWAKAEVFSSAFFAIIGLGFLLASIGFWQMGKTEMAKAYIIPTAIVGVLLIIIGFGLVLANYWRISEFPIVYNADVSAFIESEMERATKTLKGFESVVLKAIPVIIIICALVMLFLNTPTWRAICISTIAMMTVIMLIDTTAYYRLAAYKARLISAEALAKE